VTFRTAFRQALSEGFVHAALISSGTHEARNPASQPMKSSIIPVTMPISQETMLPSRSASPLRVARQRRRVCIGQEVTLV
jgi:hypothetical protein